MTDAELEAIRSRMKLNYRAEWRDAQDMLAEIDRLRALPKPIPDAELEAMRKRAEAASPAPWIWHGPEEENGLKDASGNHVIQAVTMGGLGYLYINDPDADFIASVRTFINPLLAEVDLLRKLLGDKVEDLLSNGKIGRAHV